MDGLRRRLRDRQGALVERKCAAAPPAAPKHLKNSYASETPVTDGERVYVYFGNVGLFAFDMKGKPVWSKPLGPFKTRNGWGTAASPVLHRDRIYIVNDNDEQSFLAAYDKRTGAEVWRVNREEGTNWATPFVWEHDGATEIVTSGIRQGAVLRSDGQAAVGAQGDVDASASRRRSRATGCCSSRPATSATRCGRCTRSGRARRATSR